MPFDQLSAVQRALEAHESSQDLVNVDAAATLTPSQLMVIATPPVASTYTITLPPACLWAGKFLTILSDGAAGGEVVVAANVGDARALSLADNLSAVGDYVVLYSNGLFVAVVDEVTT